MMLQEPSGLTRGHENNTRTRIMRSQTLRTSGRQAKRSRKQSTGTYYDPLRIPGPDALSTRFTKALHEYFLCGYGPNATDLTAEMIHPPVGTVSH